MKTVHPKKKKEEKKEKKERVIKLIVLPKLVLARVSPLEGL
jgi:hypothetical protein